MWLLFTAIFFKMLLILQECIHHLHLHHWFTCMIKCTWRLWQIRVVRCSLNGERQKTNLILHRRWSLSFTWAEQSVETWLWLKCPLQLSGNTSWQLVASGTRCDHQAQVQIKIEYKGGAVVRLFIYLFILCCWYWICLIVLETSVFSVLIVFILEWTDMELYTKNWTL